MRNRCNCPTDKDYPQYGGRGISVCSEWSEFNKFLADMGERPEGTTIDRVDVNGNYEPGNCRWATPTRQNRNKRSSKMIEFNGETLCVADWAEKLGIERKCLQMRLIAWGVERALTTPYVARKAA